MKPLCSLEVEILERIAAQHPQAAMALRSQMQSALVSERRNSGCGFFSDLDVPGPKEPITAKGPLGDVHVSVRGLAHGVHFLLFVNEGKASMIEGWAVDDTTGLELTSLAYEFAA